MISVDIIIQDLSQTLTKLQVSYSNFSFPNLLKIGTMPNLKVWGLPTNEKEELIKMLPDLKNSFELIRIVTKVDLKVIIALLKQ